jgi:hypothetical protein
MRYLAAFLSVALTTSSVPAQTNQPDHLWNVTVHVVDETGEPVEGASAGVGFFYGPRSTPSSIDGLTDSNGIFKASHTAFAGTLSVSVEKTGYYRTWSQYDLGYQYDPLKWNVVTDLVLKKIVAPISMYARNAQVEIPALNKPVSFDLGECDWVAPYGRGKHADVVFEAHRRWTSRRDFDCTLNVTFPNSGDGLASARTQISGGSSGPRLFRAAPLDGYFPAASCQSSNTPAAGLKENAKVENYYFRVRTVLDQQGMVKSALYGKIYGDFTLDPINSKTTWILFTYYLNPEPNSRNIEFDPARNLFRNVSPLQQVKAP